MAKGINRSPVRRRKGLGKVISSTITLFGRNRFAKREPSEFLTSENQQFFTADNKQFFGA